MDAGPAKDVSARGAGRDAARTEAERAARGGGRSTGLLLKIQAFTLFRILFLRFPILRLLFERRESPLGSDQDGRGHVGGGDDAEDPHGATEVIRSSAVSLRRGGGVPQSEDPLAQVEGTVPEEEGCGVQPLQDVGGLADERGQQEEPLSRLLPEIEVFVSGQEGLHFGQYS